MSHTFETLAPAATSSPASTRALYRKVIWRLLPFLVFAYAINAIDRLNISFAKLRMAEDIALSEAAYGIGAGIFYLGYILFEIPSNLYMQRVGARATLTRIMVLWGLVTVATAFVTTANQLIVARFFLGVAEAGFFPGVILYLTYWFPSALRGRITAVFVMSAMVAGIASGPLAGWIMTHFHGWLGLRDWQVLFVLEGIPAVLLGIFGWYWLADRPRDAKWLSEEERKHLEAALAAEAVKPGEHSRFLDVLRDPRVYIAGLVFFCVYSGSNTVSYWMPTLIRGFGVEDIQYIGLLASLPYAVGIVGMYLLGRSSDRRQERRWHVGTTMLVSAACFFLLGFAQGHLLLSVALMTVGAATAMSALSLFWTIPPALLSPSGAAGGIAVISAIGGMAGVISQIVVGAIKSATGSLYLAFDVIGLALILGALILLIGIPARQLRKLSH
ncbi:MFS transporter [Pseudomonas sp. ZM23]|uniref:MFS transporter n=1 Tax=Pseudomonas triclosanedens TaxID=2961893 RepID=A0ABY7A0D1_9PSED|nr:MFS transporter [Pseudomonas triclosanedens]MCP8464153.1 MFS transporter [Pseudomonas triclosanedens]MCP8469237.1 MFS transporter [Pseudomonas triclosanedens]MCP8475959.1 MFS transporter [Pseudomonas triclosanedens]WAI50345.1 MFS transporter [Pseudomonas triclosanedens]